MSRNFNLGSRDMSKAGRNALNAAARNGAISFSSAATNGARWNRFASYAKEELGVRYMERIAPEHVVAYGESLQAKVETGEMSAATAQNYVAAVNSVLDIATSGKWQSVSPTQDCGIATKSCIATISKAITPVQHESVIAHAGERLGVLLDLQRALGLRYEESAKLNAKTAYAEAKTTGQVQILAGTKGGRNRIVPVNEAALVALERAADIQGQGRSMIPSSMSYARFQAESYRELGVAGGRGFHGNRHWYAQDRYFQLAGAPAPVVAGWSRDERIAALAAVLEISETKAKAIDHKARMQIAVELGHGRVEITNAYLG